MMLFQGGRKNRARERRRRIGESEKTSLHELTVCWQNGGGLGGVVIL